MNLMEILTYFPKSIQVDIEQYWKRDNINLSNQIEEIRLRMGRPIILKLSGGEKVLNNPIQTEDIMETIQHICDNSIYSYQNQICHRIYYHKRRASCWINRKCGKKGR